MPAPGRHVAGGPANATKRLVKGMVGAGVDVTVVTPATLNEPFRSVGFDGAEVVVVPHDQRYMVPRRLRPWRKAAVPVIEAAGADIVHGQGVVTGGIIAADVARRVPRVVTARGNARRDTLAAYRGVGARWRAWMNDRLIEHVVGNVDVTVNVHPDWRVNLPSEPRRLVHIPNIVDEAFFAVARAPEEPRVLFCGGTRHIKGHDVLCAAWPEVRISVPHASLRLVGWPEGTPLPALPGIDSTRTLGSDALAEEMSRAALVVLPSRYEVSPILLAEAWASGTPVVSTNAGGLSSLAPGAARVVPSEDPTALAHAIVATLRGEPDTLDLVEEGRIRSERHRSNAVVAAHLNLYEELTRSA